jgi:hypothetical protein
MEYKFKSFTRHSLASPFPPLLRGVESGSDLPYTINNLKISTGGLDEIKTFPADAVHHNPG